MILRNVNFNLIIVCFVCISSSSTNCVTTFDSIAQIFLYDLFTFGQTIFIQVLYILMRKSNLLNVSEQ